MSLHVCSVPDSILLSSLRKSAMKSPRHKFLKRLSVSNSASTFPFYTSFQWPPKWEIDDRNIQYCTVSLKADHKAKGNWREFVPLVWRVSQLPNDKRFPRSAASELLRMWLAHDLRIFPFFSWRGTEGGSRAGSACWRWCYCGQGWRPSHWHRGMVSTIRSLLRRRTTVNIRTFLLFSHSLRLERTPWPILRSLWRRLWKKDVKSVQDIVNRILERGTPSVQ